MSMNSIGLPQANQSLNQSLNQRNAIAPPDSHALVNQIGKVLIIAYRESTDLLQTTLTQAGFDCEVLRQEDHPAYQTYASIYRCMLNHQRAWEQAAMAQQPTLIVEADFVPVVGLGNLPLPFNPHQKNVGMAWLYTCAPQLYSVSLEGFAEGFSTALVAYILTPQGARALQGFVAGITTQHGTGYYNFDSEMDGFLRARQLKNYIPFRNYGEHGGKANPEHRHNGMSGIHRADVLYGKLAFLPDYVIAAPVPQLQLIWSRWQARCKGIGRLATGRFLRPRTVRCSSHPGRLIRFSLCRQIAFGDRIRWKPVISNQPSSLSVD
ncbi:MAG TPA: hypothetical protein V6C57_12840 [Coleofasciculaceae cyanobacterium]